MKRILKFYCLIFILSICNISMNAQEKLQILYPVNYPRINETKVDGGTFYEKFNITVINNKEVYYDGKLIYKCLYPKYYKYLIEVFTDDDRDYLIVSPISKTEMDWVAFPHEVDRGVVLIFDYLNNVKFYTNLDAIGRVVNHESFKIVEEKFQHRTAQTIKKIDVKNKQLVIIKGGKEQGEIKLPLYEF